MDRYGKRNGRSSGKKIIESNYEDMIYMQRPISTKHKPMSMKDRAAQFAPFAALNGYKESLERTEKRIEQDC